MYLCLSPMMKTPDSSKDDRDERIVTPASTETRQGGNTKETPRMSVDLARLAKDLSELPWHEVGNNDAEVFHEMVDKIVAILAMRLQELLSSRGGYELTTEGKLPPDLLQNIRLYVTRIGESYKTVHFHAFRHAAHVTLSANKLLSMISRQEEDKDFGISEDAMLRFALVFAALVHDVSHQGVPNSTLVEEEDPIALQYNGMSVAEQYSIQVAFTILARPEFHLLQGYVMPDRETRKAFRKAVVGMVLVTDISSPERVLYNQCQWDSAFGEKEVASDESSRKRKRDQVEDTQLPSSVELRNLGVRKSFDLSGKTIQEYHSQEDDMTPKRYAVVRAMMNIADIAHTMQDFGVFCKWNKRLFQELHCAFYDDRLDWDPSVGWYSNQIDFFDGYVIPLAQKAQQCGAFGDAGSVFFEQAMENKRLWRAQGMDITNEMVVTAATELIERTKATAGEERMDKRDTKGEGDDAIA